MSIPVSPLVYPCRTYLTNYQLLRRLHLNLQNEKMRDVMWFLFTGNLYINCIYYELISGKSACPRFNTGTKTAISRQIFLKNRYCFICFWSILLHRSQIVDKMKPFAVYVNFFLEWSVLDYAKKKIQNYWNVMMRFKDLMHLCFYTEGIFHMRQWWSSVLF